MPNNVSTSTLLTITALSSTAVFLYFFLSQKQIKQKKTKERSLECRLSSINPSTELSNSPLAQLILSLGLNIQPTKHSLPEFKEQRDLLISSIKNNKKNWSPLLVEGAPNIGKGAALEYFVYTETFHRPALYLNLTEMADTFYAFLLSKLNVPEKVEREGLKDAFICITRAFNKPLLLVIDDIQLLFSNDSDFQSEFSFLFSLQSTGILDLIFCSSQQSVVLKLKKLNGYTHYLDVCYAEAVDDELIYKYLMNQVNEMIQHKFTLETCREFVDFFGLDLVEIDLYAQAECVVSEFVAKRSKEQFQCISLLLATVELDEELKDVLLQVLMSPKPVPYNTWFTPMANTVNYENVIRCLIDAHILRWAGEVLECVVFHNRLIEKSVEQWINRW